MRLLDHWHPILLSRELGQRPVAARLAGTEIVLFRTGGGTPSALVDRCAHRGMRLSCGRVEGDRLVCPYHGWGYDQTGQARCPSSPAMKPSVRAFQVVEHRGAVWIRAQGLNEVPLPELQPAGYSLIGSLRERFDVPIEPLLDNFSEVEHVPTTHDFFGYSAESLPQITVECHSSEKEVYTKFVGPSKRPFAIRALEALYGNWDVATLTIEATNRFSPVHVELDVSQQDSKGRLSGPRFKFLYFFVPTSDTTTDLVGFVYWSGVGPISRLLLRRSFLSIARREVLADKRMIERLVDTGPSLKGFALTRFDASVRESRRLLQRVYRGSSDANA